MLIADAPNGLIHCRISNCELCDMASGEWWVSLGVAVSYTESIKTNVDDAGKQEQTHAHTSKSKIATDTAHVVDEYKYSIQSHKLELHRSAHGWVMLINSGAAAHPIKMNFIERETQYDRLSHKRNKSMRTDMRFAYGWWFIGHQFYGRCSMQYAQMLGQ